MEQGGEAAQGRCQEIPYYKASSRLSGGVHLHQPRLGVTSGNKKGNREAVWGCNRTVHTFKIRPENINPTRLHGRLLAHTTGSPVGTLGDFALVRLGTSTAGRSRSSSTAPTATVSAARTRSSPAASELLPGAATRVRGLGRTSQGLFSWLEGGFVCSPRST